jgi:hypothetical protein
MVSSLDQVQVSQQLILIQVLLTLCSKHYLSSYIMMALPDLDYADNYPTIYLVLYI